MSKNKFSTFILLILVILVLSYFHWIPNVHKLIKIMIILINLYLGYSLIIYFIKKFKSAKNVREEYKIDWTLYLNLLLLIAAFSYNIIRMSIYGETMLFNTQSIEKQTFYL